MSLRIRLVVIVCMVFILIYIIRSISKKTIDYKYGLGWTMVTAIIAIFAIFPGILEWIAKVTGVIAPVNVLFFLGFILSLGIIFSLSKTVSKLQDKVNKLSQELAILRKDTHDKS